MTACVLVWPWECLRLPIDPWVVSNIPKAAGPFLNLDDMCREKNRFSSCMSHSALLKTIGSFLTPSCVVHSQSVKLAHYPSEPVFVSLLDGCLGDSDIWSYIPSALVLMLLEIRRRTSDIRFLIHYLESLQSRISTLWKIYAEISLLWPLSCRSMVSPLLGVSHDYR